MTIRSFLSALALATVTVATPALADPPRSKAAFNWEIRDGQVIRKPTDVKRVTNPDGSWREESREGSCRKTVDHLPDGSVKTSRTCD